MSGLHRFTHAMHGLEVWMFNNPRKVLAAIALLTLLFALRIPGLKIYTDFADFDALNTRAGTLGIVLEDGGARESGQAIQGEFTVRLR